MRLKTFTAKTMSDAMRQIRQELGDDAIIVNSRDAAGGVRVTAAVEQEEPSFEAALSRAGAEERDEGYTGEQIIDLISDTLLRHRVPGAVSEKIIAAAIVTAANDPLAALADGLEHTFGFAEPKAETVMLVGPPGAGKTLMAAKLAARAVLAGETPVVVTTDTARAGGIEQLGAFLHILGLKLRTAEDAKTLAAVLDGTPRTQNVIIDTGGLNPFDPKEMKALAKLMAAAKARAALVLPAGIDAEESAEMAMTFEILGVRRLVPTRLDFARRLGGILSAADRGGLAFGDASHTPQVADGIVTLDALTLAKLLLPHVPDKPPKAPVRGKGRKGKS